ncbi:MAG: NAD(P)H-binding protein [Thaumarchaeota archaeon]|nr:NAD(P)H-binding protein [Nitrososphaerota archaeon]
MDSKNTSILVAGASGFVGKRLVSRLASNPNYVVRCITRNPESLRGKVPANVQVIKGDAINISDLMVALSAVDVAYYLIHSMEGSSLHWERFQTRDKEIATNFAIAATRCKVKRIIYLGGLTNEKDPEKLSPHMRSRWEVGEVLKQSKAKVTIFRAAVILGYGGGSSEMLSYLVDRLPLMVCPKWVMRKSQPIALDDVVTYLTQAIEIEETEGRTFDIGGTEIMTYVDMMKAYAKLTGKSVRVIILPFLTPRLSSYWIDLVTPIKASLARPLIDSLKHEAIVEDDAIRKLVTIKLKSFDEAIMQSKTDEEEAEASHSEKLPRRVTLSLGIIILSLLIAGMFNATKFQLIEITTWLILLWIFSYLAIASSIFFLLEGARLGALIAGIVLWLELGLVAFEILLFPGASLYSNVSNIAASVIFGAGIIGSHVRFHVVNNCR